MNLAEKDKLNDRCISDCGTKTPVHRKVYSRDIYKMNLSREDEAFIGNALRVLPKENVTQSRLDVEFSTFVGGGRTLDVEDKKCFATQIKA